MRALAAAAVLLAACAAHRGGEMPETSLEGTRWIVVELDGQPVDLDPPPDLTLRTEEGELRVSGYGGCNRYMGRAVLGETVKFGPLMATRMYCPDPQGSTEMKLHQALERTTGLRHEGDELTLLGSDGPVARLRAGPP